MATITSIQTKEWTVADLAKRFGAIPLHRIRRDPPPGSATEEDVIAIHDRENRLCELVDGVLVEKTVGAYESFVAIQIASLLVDFVKPRRFGIVLGADGMIRLGIGLVRIPDAAFFRLEQLPGGRVPRDSISKLIPDLAVEVLSKGNTKKEMDRKLLEYFEAGARLVWYVDPIKRTVRVFTEPGQSILLGEDQVLDGGAVLPGFAVPVRDLFAEPGPA